MKSLSQLLFWVSNFACLPAFISAEGNLRGSQGTEKNPKLQMDRMLKIIGPDDRIKIDVQSEPLHAVGLVYRPDDTVYCTGVMVGRDLMLTVLDCLNKTDDGTSFKHLQFFPEYHEEGELEHSPATAVEYFYDQEWSEPSEWTRQEVAFDYVIVKLDRAVGDEVGYWETISCKQSYRFQAFYSQSLTSVSFPFFLDDKEWDGAKNWYHIGYTHEFDNEEKMVSVGTNTTNTVLSTDSYFSNGVENYLMETDVDTESGQHGGTYQTLSIDIIHAYSRY